MVTTWKEGKGQAARGIYTMTKETETYKQQLSVTLFHITLQIQKERHILAARTKADMDKLDPYFKVNNEYLAVMSKDNTRDVKPIPIKFEVKFLNINNFQSILQKNQEIQKMNIAKQLFLNYYFKKQKCKRDRAFCIHKNREAIVDANNLL